jgi:hypothetical protein
MPDTVVSESPRHSRLREQTPEFLQDYYAGRKLWGNDFSLDEIIEWYRLEENACFEDIYNQGTRRMPNNDYLHMQYGYRWALENGRSSRPRATSAATPAPPTPRPSRTARSSSTTISSTPR